MADNLLKLPLYIHFFSKEAYPYTEFSALQQSDWMFYAYCHSVSIALRPTSCATP
jgi:hypothetical protein